MTFSVRKRIVAAFAGLSLLTFAGGANAIELRPYTPEAFAAAQAEGGPIIIDIHAVWCPTCQAQRRVIEQLAEDSRFDDVVVFEIDYDSEKPYMRMHRVAERSTLISFIGAEEIDRLYAVTTFEGIEAFFAAIVE